MGSARVPAAAAAARRVRVVNEFNLPNTFAPPHFLPRFALDKCTLQAAAREVPDGGDHRRRRREDPRLGAPSGASAQGSAAVACDRQQAVAMEPVPDYKLPYRSWMSFLLRAAPGMARTAWTVWAPALEKTPAIRSASEATPRSSTATASPCWFPHPAAARPERPQCDSLEPQLWAGMKNPDISGTSSSVLGKCPNCQASCRAENDNSAGADAGNKDGHEGRVPTTGASSTRPTELHECRSNG